MANFYYNDGDASWYSDYPFTTSADFSTITEGDSILGNAVGIDLSNANLGFVQIQATLDQTNLAGAYLGSVTFFNASLRSANLQGANLNSASFTSSDFTGANLSGANLADAYLDNTNFTDANLTSVNFTGASFGSGVNFTGATFSNNVTGNFGGTYVLNGQATTLDGNGSGFWDSKAYYNGSEQSTGWNGFYYYINNVETTLDSSGSGDWIGSHYQNGSVLNDGYDSNNGVYYIGGQATTLDSDGNGEWDGQNYVNGVVQTPAVDLEDGLQAFYKLSDLSDSSGNNRTLTNNGNVSFASGKIENAAVLTNGTLSNNSLNFNGFNGLSFSAWVKVNTSNVGPWSFLSRYSDDNGGQLFFGNYNPDDSNFLGLLLNTDDSSYEVQTSDHSAFDGDWHFVTVSYDGQTLKMYIDGQVIGSQSAIGVISDSSAPFMIGGSAQEVYPTNPFDGQIDAVGIWNRALNSAEVAALYNNGDGLEIGTTPNLNTLTKIEGNAKFYGKVKFGV